MTNSIAFLLPLSPQVVHDASRTLLDSLTLKLSPPTASHTIELEAHYALASNPHAHEVKLLVKNIPADRLLILESDTGAILISRAQQLRSDIARLYPTYMDAEGTIDLRSISLGHSEDTHSTPWHWSSLSVIRMSDTGNHSLMLHWLDQQLCKAPGLYHWQGKRPDPQDRLEPNATELQQYAAQEKPVLLLIHGLGSNVRSTFGELAKGSTVGSLHDLKQVFGNRLYAYEHETFSLSPLENALALLKRLPKGLHLNLLAHSRGGLIADLLCLHESIDSEQLELLPTRERAQLQELLRLLTAKQLKIERYVRVATPAAGTGLLADHLSIFLSTLLTLLNDFAQGIASLDQPNDFELPVLRRAVMEINIRQLRAQDIPGLNAMIPDAALTRFLAQGKRRRGILMAIISGNTTQDGSSLLRHMAITFSDWVLFNGHDNDFVVETRSMRAGLTRQNPSHEYPSRGATVSHFAYFARPDSRKAIYQWLSHSEPLQLTKFIPIPTDIELPSAENRALETALTGKKPSLILIPDFMGTNLYQAGQHIWFNPSQLAQGAFVQLAMGNEVDTGELVQYSYGDLVAYLEKDFQVISFAYDWRQSFAQHAADLLDTLQAILNTHSPQHPISLLAHGSGGLVLRALLLEEKGQALWQNIAQRPHSYCLMLGTPNHGMQSAVNFLLGRTPAIRELALLDEQNDLQDLLNVLGDFPGLLELMPPASAIDLSLQAKVEQNPDLKAFNNFHLSSWKSMRIRNQDHWLPPNQHLGAHPQGELLKQAASFWKDLLKQEKQGLPQAERFLYIFGEAEHTPLGLIRDADQLILYATPSGDGWVSWDSGRLQSLPERNYWYMPTSHPQLSNDQRYFSAIAELLRTGDTRQLSRQLLRTQQHSAAGIYRYNVPPPLRTGAEEMTISFFGGVHKPSEKRNNKYLLEVSVRAMDLRFARNPILCGHYRSDTIAGAEYQIDQHIVQGALTQRERMGIYADEMGTSTIVLMPRSREDVRQCGGKGAIIVGLGEWEHINAQAITASVRDAVLKYLLHDSHHLSAEQMSLDNTPPKLCLNSLLMGYNSTTHISIQASIDAVVLGVCEANQQYRYNLSKDQVLRQITHLEFIEIYLDTAISAAYAIRKLPQRLGKELNLLQTRLELSQELRFQQGMRHRLSERNSSNGYWPRLMITTPQDANASHKAAIPPQLRYVYLSERARAEATLQQHQPGLIDSLLGESIRNSYYHANISRTLFQLLIPLELKSAARQTERLLLVVDEYTASLPWEMLQADEEPLVLRMAVVRQLVSTRYRRKIAVSLQKSAFVLGNPSTEGFYKYFPAPKQYTPPKNKALPELLGAGEEANEVANILRKANYQVNALYQTGDSAPLKATHIFNELFKQPYRVLMIAAHGEYRLLAQDGIERTGVILSDGVLLTAAEMGQMEEVPDLVFLNCCHLGQTGETAPLNNTPYNRLAYSLSRELIEMGVRCVVAAGWAVNDQAATTFATSFFDAFVTRGQSFGMAIWEARRTTWDRYPDINTWGAYQAYGDPNYLLRADDELTLPSSPTLWTPVAPQELRTRLEALAVDIQYQSSQYYFAKLEEEISSLLNRVPQNWTQEPSIQYLLACLYGEMLPEGFLRAQSACQTAIAEEGRNNTLPIRALELLGKLEARQAEILGEKVTSLRHALQTIPPDTEKYKGIEKQLTSLCERANHLITQALKYLHNLLDITQHIQSIAPSTAEGHTPLIVNTERYALLGDVYRHQAMVGMYCGSSWAELQNLLQTAREAYAHAEQHLTTTDAPHAPIHRLLLDFILGKPSDQALPQAKQALKKAREHFQSSYSFKNALLLAQAALAVYLWGGDLHEAVDQQAHLSAQEALLQIYRESLLSMNFTPRKISEATQQLKQLESWLKLRHAAQAALEPNEKRDEQLLTLRTLADGLKNA
ncbi:MAG: hypothetical protein CR991_07855 [Proteobacteria bacterium]|nr:MAG: hypothetical protein CR991_07855 [Pseudomonadota bacterium]